MSLSRSSLLRLGRQQMLYLSVAAIVAAIFWAIGQRVNPATVLLYSMLFGNLVTPSMEYLGRHYWHRPFPYNWIAFLLVLAVVTVPVYVGCTVVVWSVAPPSPQTLEHLLLTGWKFPVLVIVVYSAVGFIYRTSRERMEQRTRDLERTLQMGSAQLALQEQELARAREIQQSLLPKSIPVISGFEVAAAWRPARTVSGDYFDVFRLSSSKTALCIADVVGKGVSAALLMANVQAAVRAFAHQAVSPAELCTKVNTLLCESIATGKFVTFLFGVLDCEDCTFTYCNAGHLAPLLVTGNEVRWLDASGAVLGVFPEWSFGEEVIGLLGGDRLLLFTDGITEAEAPDGGEFGEERLAAAARRNQDLTAAQLNELILTQTEGFCGGHFQDDATLLIVAADAKQAAERAPRLVG